MKQRPGRLVKNALALIVSGAGTGVIGVVFWGVAAHLVSPAVIGRTSAEISAMILLSTLAQLSFGSTFERFLPIAGPLAHTFVTRAYVLCCSIALVIASGYVALGIGHRFLPHSFGWRALFVGSVVLWTMFALQDSVLIGLRAAKIVPVKNITHAAAKLALLPVFVLVSTNQGIILAWLIPALLVLLVVNWNLFSKRLPQHEASSTTSGVLPSIRELISLTGAQYATLLITVLSGSIVSLIVIDRLGPVASADYYLPAQIWGGAAVAIWSVNTSFLVEASAEPHNLYQHARVAVRAGAAVLAACVGFGVALAPEILRIFGASYSSSGTTLMRLMLLSLPGVSVTALYSSFAWIDRRVWRLTIREILSAAIYFALILTLIHHYRILSIGIASLIGSAAQGLLFLPLVVKRYRRLMVEGTRDATGSTPVAEN